MSDSLVIIPTYNEKENIADIIRAVLVLPVELHLLIVDDNSPDGTGDIVKSLQDEFEGRLFLEERAGKMGLGTAYIHGFKWALQRHYQFIFEMDADFSHPPKDLINLLNSCKHEKNDLTIGSRYITGVNVVNWPMSRVLLSFLASYYVRFITGLPISDTTAGFKCYRREVLETIELDKVRFMGYAFQIEMKFLAWKYGFKLAEVPIIFTDRTRGTSKLSGNIIKEAIFGVLRIKINSLFRSYRRNTELAPTLIETDGLHRSNT
jgi:dolichol-phosphate mannosyltransferase